MYIISHICKKSHLQKKHTKMEKSIKERVDSLPNHGIASQLKLVRSFLAIPGWSCEI